MRSLMLNIVMCAFSACLEISMSAQPAPEIPSGPLIQQRAPDYASWTIAPAPVTSSTSSKNSEKQITITVVKTKDYMVQQSVNTNGETWYCWYHAGLTALVYPNGKDVVLVEGALRDGAEAFYQSDFSITDFPKFSWITPQSYAGVEKVGGEELLTFQGEYNEESGRITPVRFETNGNKNATGPERKSITRIVAYVNAKNRLPAFLKNDNSMLILTFNPPPQAMLQIPPNVAAVIKMKQVSIQSMIRKFP